MRAGGSAGLRPGAAGVNRILKWLRDDDGLDVTVNGGMVVRMTDLIDGGKATWKIDSVNGGLKVVVGGNDMTVMRLVLSLVG